MIRLRLDVLGVHLDVKLKRPRPAEHVDDVVLNTDVDTDFGFRPDGIGDRPPASTS
jgi:hypothetical protein